tara:strand:+ start:5033 stop:5620 length:588 start_codon:yes stop_codon:yes gene_type:complete
MNAISYLITLLIDFYLILVLLRIWLQAAGADFYNPLSQFTVKATQPVLAPLRRAVPSMGRLDTAGIVLAIGVSLSKWCLLIALQGQPINLAITLFLAVLSCMKELGTLLFWMLIIRAVLSWVSQGYNAFEMVLAQLTEPFMEPIRSRLPSLGGLDLSPMILIVLLNFINLLIPDLLNSIGQLLNINYLGSLWYRA